MRIRRHDDKKELQRDIMVFLFLLAIICVL